MPKYPNACGVKRNLFVFRCTTETPPGPSRFSLVSGSWVYFQRDIKLMIRIWYKQKTLIVNIMMKSSFVVPGIQHFQQLNKGMDENKMFFLSNNLLKSFLSVFCYTLQFYIIFLPGFVFFWFLQFIIIDFFCPLMVNLNRFVLTFLFLANSDC